MKKVGGQLIRVVENNEKVGMRGQNGICII